MSGSLTRVLIQASRFLPAELTEMMRKPASKKAIPSLQPSVPALGLREIPRKPNKNRAQQQKHVPRIALTPSFGARLLGAVAAVLHLQRQLRQHLRCFACRPSRSSLGFGPPEMHFHGFPLVALKEETKGVLSTKNTQDMMRAVLHGLHYVYLFNSGLDHDG